MSVLNAPLGTTALRGEEMSPLQHLSHVNQAPIIHTMELAMLLTAYCVQQD